MTVDRPLHARTRLFICIFMWDLLETRGRRRKLLLKDVAEDRFKAPMGVEPVVRRTGTLSFTPAAPRQSMQITLATQKMSPAQTLSLR